MTSKKKIQKKVKRTERLKGRDTVSRLYNSVIEYVEELGGSCIVIGGIAIVQEDPNENRFGIMVRVLGKKPTFPFKPSK